LVVAGLLGFVWVVVSIWTARFTKPVDVSEDSHLIARPTKPFIAVLSLYALTVCALGALYRSSHVIGPLDQPGTCPIWDWNSDYSLTAFSLFGFGLCLILSYLVPRRDS
jgi:hypothetical protein